MTPKQTFLSACRIALAHPQLKHLPLERIFNRLDDHGISIADALAQHFVVLALAAAETVDDPNSKPVPMSERWRRLETMKDITPTTKERKLLT
jgi:hypothetical protein